MAAEICAETLEKPQHTERLYPESRRHAVHERSSMYRALRPLLLQLQDVSLIGVEELLNLKRLFVTGLKAQMFAVRGWKCTTLIRRETSAVKSQIQ